MFKKSDSSMAENYRPVALISVFSKKFEKVLLIRLKCYCDSQGILNPSQYGYKQGTSTIDAAYALLEYVISAKAKKRKSRCDLPRFK